MTTRIKIDCDHQKRKQWSPLDQKSTKQNHFPFFLFLLPFPSFFLSFFFFSRRFSLLDHHALFLEPPRHRTLCTRATVALPGPTHEAAVAPPGSASGLLPSREPRRPKPTRRSASRPAGLVPLGPATADACARIPSRITLPRTPSRRRNARLHTLTRHWPRARWNSRLRAH